jgi:hypothetical protein
MTTETKPSTPGLERTRLRCRCGARGPWSQARVPGAAVREAEMLAEDHYGPDTALSASKNYMDLKHAASTALPQGVHFTLIEAVADHVIETLFLQDPRIRRIKLKIIKLAIAENGEIDRPGSDGGEQQRMAIRFRARHEFTADIARSAGAVIHHHLLAKPGGKTLGGQSPNQIRGAGGGEGDDQADGSVGKPLRQGGHGQGGAER